MEWRDWMSTVGKLNLAFPHQKIDPGTARLWFEPLKTKTAAAVDRAALRCLTERDFITCHALIEAAAANARGDAEETRRALATAPTPSPLGVPPSPEVKAQLDRILGRRP